MVLNGFTRHIVAFIGFFGGSRVCRGFLVVWVYRAYSRVYRYFCGFGFIGPIVGFIGFFWPSGPKPLLYMSQGFALWFLLRAVGECRPWDVLPG